MRSLVFGVVAALVAIGCGDGGGGTGGLGGSGGAGASGHGGSTHTSSGGGPGVGGSGTNSGGAGTGGFGGAPPQVVDATSMQKKMLLGYQGWFSCKGDGAPPDRWVHWFRSDAADAASATVDLWPDVRELDPDELFATAMTYGDGSPAKLYSAFVPKTVARHFSWMKDAGIDGVWLQRFSSELHDPAFLALRDQVAQNVMAGAEANGRVFALMYDISGTDPATMVADIQADWTHLVDDLHLTASDRYLHHDGKPVLGLWGPGFSDRTVTPQQAQQIIDWLRTGTDSAHQVFLLGGVPTYWRTLTQDSQTMPEWANVYRSYDVISPWAVGRYVDAAGADAFAQNLVGPDITEATAAGRLYMPVVFPGFTWHNLMNGGSPPNQIPRLGGTFYWRQVYDDLNAGATMLFGAMFDEVDEGTAMMKVAETQASVPAQGTWVSYDADGTSVPSDFYLRLAGEATKCIRGDAPLSPNLPIQP